jgi:hypothetical protein
MINNGFTPDQNDYEFCAKVENMVIPHQGHFGISAATGGLAGKSCYLLILKVCELSFIGNSVFGDLWTYLKTIIKRLILRLILRLFGTFPWLLLHSFAVFGLLILSYVVL